MQRIYKKPLPKIEGLRIEKDVQVKMRDGISLLFSQYFATMVSRLFEA